MFLCLELIDMRTEKTGTGIKQRVVWSNREHSCKRRWKPTMPRTTIGLLSRGATSATVGFLQKRVLALFFVSVPNPDSPIQDLACPSVHSEFACLSFPIRAKESRKETQTWSSQSVCELLNISVFVCVRMGYSHDNELE